MQVSTSTWRPPDGVLGGIVRETTTRVAALRADAPAVRKIEQEAAAAPAPPSFRDALRRREVAVIAEVKRRSPSRGEINAALSAADQARAYATGGAAAVSVLTEPRHFGGSLDDLRAVRAAVGLPVLRKDFIIHEIQLLEARAAGASAALLITRALAPAALQDLAGAARGLGIEALVEIRDELELERAMACGARVVGVNHRDLETLVIDPAVGERLLPLVPPTCVAIAESGVRSASDVERVARAGADAVLVGSVLSAAGDPGAAVRALTSVPRSGRGG